MEIKLSRVLFEEAWLATVENVGKLHKQDKRFQNITFNLVKKYLNVPLLIKKEALYITYAHDEPLVNNPDFLNKPEGIKQINSQDKNGFIIMPDEDWSFSVVTFWNTLHDDWASLARKYKKPSSYKEAEQYINDPNIIYDGKYLQILWSAYKKGLQSNQVFIE